MTEWIIWGALLLLQNASFTWVGRARNSSSVWYHAIAAVASNGVFILNQFVIVNKLVDVKRSGSMAMFAFVVVFYTLFTVTGSVAMHSFLMRHVERGKRKIG